MDTAPLAAELSMRLRRELTLARGSVLHPFDRRGLDSYVSWLQLAIRRLDDGPGGPQAVYDEWFATRPRCARRAMAAAVQTPA